MWGHITMHIMRDEQRRIQTPYKELLTRLYLQYNLSISHLFISQNGCIPHIYAISLHLNTFSNLQHKSNVLFSAAAAAGEVVWCAMAKAMCARKWEWQMYATISTMLPRRKRSWANLQLTYRRRQSQAWFLSRYLHSIESIRADTTADPNKTCIDKFDKITCAQVESCVHT